MDRLVALAHISFMLIALYALGLICGCTNKLEFYCFLHFSICVFIILRIEIDIPECMWCGYATRNHFNWPIVYELLTLHYHIFDQATVVYGLLVWMDKNECNETEYCISLDHLVNFRLGNTFLEKIQWYISSINT